MLANTMLASSSEPLPIRVPKYRSPWALPLSLLAHAGLLAALVLSVAWKSEPPPALQAELWGAMPSNPNTAAPPNAQIVPETKPEPVVLKPTPSEPVPTPPPDAIAPALAKQTPQPPQPPKVAQPRPEVNARDSARDTARAKEIARMSQLSQSAGLPPSPVASTVPNLVPSTAPSTAQTLGTPQAGTPQALGAGWGAKLKACVQPNLRYSDASGDNPRVVFVVKLSPSGTPIDANLSKSSGNPAFDAAVSRALLRCDPFPKPETGAYPASVTVAYRLND